MDVQELQKTAQVLDAVLPSLPESVLATEYPTSLAALESRRDCSFFISAVISHITWGRPATSGAS